MNRKERRKSIPGFILHSNDFKSPKEEVMDDGSIKIYVKGYASTKEKDSHGDIVLPTAFNIERYMQNPILKAGHKDGEAYNIGRVEKIFFDDYGMFIDGYVVLREDIENHKTLLHGIRHGLINGFSIGFGNMKTHYDTEAKANIITDLTLYEISLVDIPSNPMTIRKAVNKFLSSFSNKMNIGQVIKFRVKYEDRLSDEKIGQIMEIKTEGSVLSRDVMQATPENPIITIRSLLIINDIGTQTTDFVVANMSNIIVSEEMDLQVKSVNEEQKEETKEAVEETIETTEEQTQATEKIETPTTEQTETVESTETIETKDEVVEEGKGQETEQSGNGQPENGVEATQTQIAELQEAINVLAQSQAQMASDFASAIQELAKSKKSFNTPSVYVHQETDRDLSPLAKQLKEAKR